MWVLVKDGAVIYGPSAYSARHFGERLGVSLPALQPASRVDNKGVSMIPASVEPLGPQQQQGAPIFGAESIVFPAEDIYPTLALALSAAKTLVISGIYRHMAALVTKAAGDYAPAEQARWSQLVSECEARWNGGAYDGPNSGFLVSSVLTSDPTGVPTDDELNSRVDTVLAKRDAHEGFLSAASKNRDAHTAGVMALSSPDDVLAYDYMSGWPA